MSTDPGKSTLKSQVRFAMVPEWLIYSGVSHGAVRLYAVLDRHANRENVAWPSRATLGRLMGCSTDTVDGPPPFPILENRQDRTPNEPVRVEADPPGGSRTHAARWPHRRGEG
jgi:hypothetical protein